MFDKGQKQSSALFVTALIIFAPKHRLWVLVRTASNLCFEQKQQKYQNFSAENVKFLKLKKSLYMAWASFRNASFDLLQVCPT